VTKGQRFTLAGQVYYIELIGPKTTLCVSEDGSREHFETYYLQNKVLPMQIKKDSNES
jgi:sorbitol-specific phosphotransferase system component IIA